MKIQNRDVRTIDGYCYELIGIRRIPTFVVDLNDNLILGQKWFEDIVSSKQSMNLQKIVVAEFLEYRRDVTEEWIPHPFRKVE
jgi:hypothetical protein